jgi:hypothetical protein
MKNGLKNPKKADLDKDGKLSGYEKKRGMAVEKAMGAKKGKMFRNGGNVLVPFIDYKSIAGMGKTKPKKKKQQIKEQNEKVSAIVPKPKSYTLTDLSETKKGLSETKSKKYKSLPVYPETNPRLGFDQADEAALSEKLRGEEKPTTRKQSGAPTFPATMTVAGATSSVMKGTGTEGRKAKRFRRSQQNIKSLKDYESGRRQRAYESRIATADFFSGLLGSLGSQKAYPAVLEDIAEPYKRKKGGSLGVKLAKGGFKKKTPIY